MFLPSEFFGWKPKGGGSGEGWFETQAAAMEEGAENWPTCALTSVRLDSGPAVADERGNLVSKEALVKALLRGAPPPPLSHIRKLKHTVQCSISYRAGKVVCPVTGDEMHGGKGAALLWRCGCLVILFWEMILHSISHSKN